MYGIGNDTTNVIAHAVVTGSGATAIATPDYTTQIIAVISQIVALAILLLRKK